MALVHARHDHRSDLANSAWGTYWSWQPKETSSLIIWVVYLAFLHLRTIGWRGKRMALLTIFGFVLVLIQLFYHQPDERWKAYLLRRHTNEYPRRPSDNQRPSKCARSSTSPEQAPPDALRKLMTYEGVRKALSFPPATASRSTVRTGQRHGYRPDQTVHPTQPESLDLALYVYPDAQGVACVSCGFEPRLYGRRRGGSWASSRMHTISPSRPRPPVRSSTSSSKKAISVAKRVRTETKLAEGAVSISSAAVELAKKIFGDLEERRGVLGCGGDGGTGSATPPQNASRTWRPIAPLRAAEELALEFKGDAIRFEHFPDAMVMIDILICATGAPRFVITRDMVAKVVRNGATSPSS